ncbi:nucleotide disphospho-sugar-binding domain-containing protein [Streptomyces sp. NPDC006326]|uniref:glycosyltransferase n=1 Tax=Streptomyces sp. NPDC006326 TaxID=3156752 RepID=UPI0033AA7647
MRILFASVGNFGHIFPLLPLARAARAAGHEVAFATGEQFHQTLREAGFEPVTAGRSVPEAFIEAAGGQAFLEQHGGEVGAQDVPAEVLADLHIKVFGSVLPRWVAADLAPALERLRPDLVVHEVLNPGAGFAARLAGIPAVAHGVGVLAQDHEAARLQQEVLATAAELGVDVPDGQAFTLGNTLIDICPPSLQDPAVLSSGLPRIEQRPVSFKEEGELPGGLGTSGEPFVYLTLGTALGSAENLRTVIDGLTPLGLPVLVATGFRVQIADLGELPDNVVAAPWLPQSQVLARAALVVQHGGSGTTLATLEAGLPQLIVPQGADGPANGRAVHAAGAGEVVFDLTAETVTEYARRILGDDGYREAARKIAAEIASLPGPDEIAAKLPSFAA